MQTPNTEVGVFNNVPNDDKPLRELITAGINNCVVFDLPEENREDFKKWYGETLHQRAFGTIHNDVHNRGPNGSHMRTSLILRDVTHEDGTRYLHTLNSIYEVLS